MSQVIIFGSSNSFGKTKKVIDDILGHSNIRPLRKLAIDEEFVVEFPKRSIPLVDLNDFDITPFDYDHLNLNDDFIPLIERLLAYDTWIIATPVYWYNMSTQHKIFFDRFSDLLTIRKDLGRQLRGKRLFVISSFGDSYPKGFEDTFEQICEYLGMEYLGSSFFYSGTKHHQYLDQNKIESGKVKSKLGISL